MTLNKKDMDDIHSKTIILKGWHYIAEINKNKVISAV